AATSFLRGEYATTNNEAQRAIAAYTEAVARLRSTSESAAAVYWSRAFNRQPSEQLAFLYANQNEYGEALRQTDIALKAYQILGDAPPQRLLLTRVSALLN